MFRFVELIDKITMSKTKEMNNPVNKTMGKHLTRYMEFLGKLEPVEIRYRGVNY